LGVYEIEDSGKEDGDELLSILNKGAAALECIKKEECEEWKK